jgi:hypothetical protein
MIRIIFPMQTTIDSVGGTARIEGRKGKRVAVSQMIISDEDVLDMRASTTYERLGIPFELIR